MTTVTIIIGNPRSGRRLVGLALAEYIRNKENKQSFCISQDTNLKPDNFDKGLLDDLILVSSSMMIESWMEPWIDEFGEPLFIINSMRMPRWPSEEPPNDAE